MGPVTHHYKDVSDGLATGARATDYAILGVRLHMTLRRTYHDNLGRISLSLYPIQYKSHCKVLPLRYKRAGPLLFRGGGQTSTPTVTRSTTILRLTLHWTRAPARTSINLVSQFFARISVIHHSE
jgi:hypothetical protein